MALQLNSTREAYREFYGRNTEQMPKLIADGRVPMNTAQLMQKRLDYRKGSEEVKTAWMDNYFDTGDAVAYHPNGNLKMVLDSELLRKLNPQGVLRSGAMVLPEGIYETLQGAEFTRKDLEKHVDKSLTVKQAKSNPVWKALARDIALLDDYTDYIFAEGKQRFDFNEMMGVYPASAQDVPTLRAWYVRWLGNRSNAYGRGSLDDSVGRLVGIAPEALGAKNLSLEKFAKFLRILINNENLSSGFV